MNERLLAIALSWALACTSAHAAVTCRFSSTAALSFGTYDVFSATPRDSQANLTVTCDRDGGAPTVSVTVSLGGTTPSARAMTAAGVSDRLTYALFQDSARTVLWGSTPGSDTATRSLSIPNKGSASVVFTVYARIPAGQTVSAGIYGDSVQATVSP